MRRVPGRGKRRTRTVEELCEFGGVFRVLELLCKVLCDLGAAPQGVCDGMETGCELGRTSEWRHGQMEAIDGRHCGNVQTEQGWWTLHGRKEKQKGTKNDRGKKSILFLSISFVVRAGMSQ